MYLHTNLRHRDRVLVDWLLGRERALPQWSSQEWSKALDLCNREETEGLAYRLIRDAGSGATSVPLPLLRRLELSYKRTVARHMVSSQALEQIDFACEKQGTQLMVLRGIELADLLYRDPGCRDFLDVDLVAPPGSYQSSGDILRELGFQNTGHQTYLFERGPIEVDLHQDPANIYLFPAYGKVFDYSPQPLWKASKRYLHYQALRRLAEPDELNFLILHLVKHSFDGLIWWIDIYRHASQLGSEGLLEACRRARSYRLHRLVEGFLGYLHQLFPELPYQPSKVGRDGIEQLFKLMLRGKRLPRTGMIMFLLSIPEFRWRLRLVGDKLLGRYQDL